MSASTIRAAIEDATATVRDKFRADGLRACQGQDWRAVAEVMSSRVESPERRQYIDTYVIAAEHAVTLLADLN